MSAKSTASKQMLAVAVMIITMIIVVLIVAGCGSDSKPQPSATPEPTATSTPEPTATPTDTPTATPTDTPTPEPTATSTATSTPVPTVTPTATSTPDPGLVTMRLGENCTLPDAVRAVENGRPEGGCPAGGERNVIEFTGDVTLRRSGAGPGSRLLREITGNIVFEGNGFSLISASDDPGHFLIIRLSAVVTVRNLTLIGGRAQDSGAIFNEGRLTVENCTFFDNQVARYGGSINNRGWLSISNSTFRNGWAGTGGAIYNLFNANDLDNGLFITNTTFFKNNSRNGGNVFIETGGEGPIEIVNTTFLSGDAGSIVVSGGTVLLVNSIIAGSGSNDCELREDNSAFTGDHNLSDDPDCPGAESPSGVAEELGDHGGETETVALLEGSSAIGAGNAEYCPDTDQRGAPRDDGACDIGAYEFGAEVPGEAE